MKKYTYRSLYWGRDREEIIYAENIFEADDKRTKYGLILFSIDKYF